MTSRSGSGTQLKTLSVNLMVQDVDTTLDYYRGLGFDVLQKSPESGITQWAHVENGGVRLMFQSSTSLKKEFGQLENYREGGALTLWIQVENISEWYDQVKDKTNVLKKLGTTPYNGANEFVIVDPNGFILHFSDLKL